MWLGVEGGREGGREGVRMDGWTDGGGGMRKEKVRKDRKKGEAQPFLLGFSLKQKKWNIKPRKSSFKLK